MCLTFHSKPSAHVAACQVVVVIISTGICGCHQSCLTGRRVCVCEGVGVSGVCVCEGVGVSGVCVCVRVCVLGVGM